MSRHYFGTDGIRGRVGESPITAEFVLKLGWAVGRVLSTSRSRSILIGKDTRISGYLFESALEAGLLSAGANIILLGPMPTPAIAYLTRTFRAGAGIVISASHNPYTDNGFKFFSGKGEKLPDELEHAIEEALDQPFETVPANRLGKAWRMEDAGGRYIEFCKGTIGRGLSLAGLHIVVDCAHGATYHVAPRVFSELGAEVHAIGIQPDGFNINQGCGSTDLTALRQAVMDRGADLGVAFDGDGDRTLMVDHAGSPVDGDELLYIAARARRERGSLAGGVVGTLMTNLGIEQALRDLGVPFRRAPVGDRYVHQALKEEGWLLGGESSGHLLFLDKTTTGDGIVSALEILEAMVESGQRLADLRAGLEKFPQHMINVPVSGKVDLDASAAVGDRLRKVEAALGDDGRVILRASGTEPVVRVTVEGRHLDQVRSQAQSLADAVEKEFSK